MSLHKHGQSRGRKSPAREPSGPESPDAELLPMRQHSLPHDVNHLCKRVSWLENFYEILYACQVEDVDIPFTVVYQYSQPYAAYFSEEGQVRKIESKDLEVPNPLKPSHSHNHSATNVLAELANATAKQASLHKCHTGVESMRIFSRDAVLQGDRNLVVEYLTAEDAENFLLWRAKDQNGVVQRFVQPNTPKVVSHKVYWTPYHMQVDAVQNNHLADAADLPAERRCCTFDGHQNDVSDVALNKAVEKKILEATSKIVAAVRRLVPKRVEIQVMVLHFKASSRGKVWFMYCGSLRLLDSSDGKAGPGAKMQIGIPDMVQKKRLFAVTTDRPRTARAEEPQLPPAKGRAAQKRKGRVCIVSGAFLGKDGHLKYTATFQDIILHFLWHGLSTGFEKVGNRKAAERAIQNEERVARMLKLGSSTPVRRSLRTLLTGDPSNPLLFVKDPAAVEKAMGEDELLRAAYRLWQDAMTLIFAQEIDNLVEETFNDKKGTDAFLQHEAAICEDVLLEFSSSLSQLLVGWEDSKPAKRPARGVSKRDSPGQIKCMDSVGTADKENSEPARSRRSVSCPPGQVGQERAASKGIKSVKWGQVEEQQASRLDEYGLLSGKEAHDLAQYLIKEGPSFFGTMHGNRWRHPAPDANRFIQNQINQTEYLYWFHLYASVGLSRGEPSERSAVKKKIELSPRTLSFEPGKHMTFNDLVEFLFGVGLMPTRVSRATAAHVFHAINKDYSVNDDDVRLLDSNEFSHYMKKLLPQLVCAERYACPCVIRVVYAESNRLRALSPTPCGSLLL